MTGTDMNKPPLAVIAGPTAGGKSALALTLAKERRGTIINADASQVYADLRILSARPDAAEEAQAPHRLYGAIDGAEPCSAARWAALARTAIDEAWQEGRLPILVGGTGLYLRALIDGLAPVPPIDDEVRATIRNLAPEDARAALEREDPIMAARLHARDRQRNARALEVIRSTGKSLAAWQTNTTGGLLAKVRLETRLVLPQRDILYMRCDARLDAMMAAGALAEVAALRDRKLSPQLPVMKALGVPPLLRHLAGELSLADAVSAAKTDTRRYAKRQLTWFVSGGQAGGWLAVAQRTASPTV